MKAYTDIEQSKKLAEILPLESADGFWEFHTEWGAEGDKWEGYEDYPSAVPYLEYTRMENEWKEEKQDMPCWSLDALLEAMPQSITKYIESERCQKTFHLNLFRSYYHCCSYCTKSSVSDDDDDTLYCFGRDNWIDSCYEMILKLNKLNLL